ERASIRRRSAISIDVLSKQRDLSRPLRYESSNFCLDLCDWPRVFRAACIGHHTERAEFVATLLDCDESRWPAGRRLIRKCVELVDCWKVRFERVALLTRDARNHLGQAMISLWTDNEIDRRLSIDDLLAFGLRYATGDGDRHLLAGRAAALFDGLEPAQLRIHFLRCLLADVTGVEDDHVGVFWRLRRRIAQRRQEVRHTRGVVDVHLTAIGLDEEPFHGRVM